MTQLPLFNEKQSLCSKQGTPGSLQICNLRVEKSIVGTSSDSQVRNTRCWEVYGEPILLPSQEINLCLIILNLKVAGMTKLYLQPHRQHCAPP